MRLFAAPMRGTKKTASVIVGVELSGRDLTFGTGNKVEVAFAAISQRSKVVASRRDTLTLDMTFEAQARVQNGAIRLVHLISLPPGRYRLQAAAVDPLKNSVGSVFTDVEVPDFTKKDSLMMSGLMITS